MPTAVGVTTATPAAIRAAIDRSLPLLQEIDVAFIKRTGCVSCHHNSLVAMAVATARANGYHGQRDHGEDAVARRSALPRYRGERGRCRTFHCRRRRTRSATCCSASPVEHYPPDAATDAQAIWLKRRQAPDGRWPVADDPAADRIQRHRSDRCLAARATGVRAARAARRIHESGRSRGSVADDREGHGDRGACVSAARTVVGARAGRSIRRRGPRAACRAATPMAAGRSSTSDAERRLRDRRGAGRAARERRGRRDRSRRSARASNFCCARRSTTARGSSQSRSEPIQADFASGFPYGAHNGSPLPRPGGR